MLTASVDCQLAVLSMLDCELASEDGGWWLTYEISEGLFLSHSPVTMCSWVQKVENRLTVIRISVRLGLLSG